MVRLESQVGPIVFFMSFQFTDRWQILGQLWQILGATGGKFFGLSSQIGGKFELKTLIF